MVRGHRVLYEQTWFPLKTVSARKFVINAWLRPPKILINAKNVRSVAVGKYAIQHVVDAFQHSRNSHKFYRTSRKTKGVVEVNPVAYKINRG